MTAPIVLPDCRQWEGRFHLSAEEKRELVQRIAAQGPGAIEAFIAERSAQDGTIAARVAKWRAELVARAEALKRALEEQFASRKAETLSELAERERTLHGQREATEAQLREFRLHRDARLAEVLANSTLLQVALEGSPPRPGLLARLRNAWARFVTWLLTLLGLRRAPQRRRKSLLAAVPMAGRFGLDLGRLESALYSPAMRQRVASRMQGLTTRERLREAWNRLLGRSDYEEVAAALMEEELRRQVEAKDRELAAQEEAMAGRLAKLAEEEAQARARERDALAQLDREREEALRRLRDKAAQEPLKRMAEEVQEDFELAGYVQRGKEGLQLTDRLVDRFSEMVFEAEMKALPAHHRQAYGSYVEGEGVFRKEPLLSVDELGHMDLVGSVVQARQRHPRQRHLYEEDVLVYREMRASTTHVVLIFDTSGSMEDNRRIDAAKRAALALHQAAKRDSKGNRVDLVLMETSVRRAELLDAWLAKPRGFTNTGGALALARALLERSRADRKLVYLITDGLPEAMTLPDGTDIASYPDKCLDYALQEARKLKAIPGLGFAVLLLEPEDEMYVKAAQRIADVLGGKVLPTDPQALAREVLVDFDTQRRAARKAEAPRAR